jgi:hypothetical protein
MFSFAATNIRSSEEFEMAKKPFRKYTYSIGGHFDFSFYDMR